MSLAYTGYIEGYYGRLPEWSERLTLVKCLAAIGQHYYWYAPKEDPLHRVNWRQPYPQAWVDAFSAFCAESQALGVGVIAGVAPGLDFDFAALDVSAGATGQGAGTDSDFTRLVSKARVLETAGAQVIALLLDDIDADFLQRCGAFRHEGQAHAALANALEAAVSVPVIVVPRIYANSLVTEAPDYLTHFSRTLSHTVTVSLCGDDVVAKTVSVSDYSRYADFSPHRVVAWDNLYANDYCPRRLYTGAWVGRGELTDVMLNPTGMIQTDCLLLALTAVGESHQRARRRVLAEHGVPACFEAIEHFLWLPPFGAIAGVADPAERVAFTEEQAAAMEQLLWRWKSPLAREWYPYLMGLKSDLLMGAGQLGDDRIRKTQLPPLTGRLL